MEKIRNFWFIPVLLLAFFLGLGGGYQLKEHLSSKKPPSQNRYVAFVGEVYDKIKEHYWRSLTDKELANTFQSALETAVLSPQIDRAKDKRGLIKILEKELGKIPQAKKKELVLKMVENVLLSLEPKNRSRLLSEAQKKKLQAMVENINNQRDLFDTLKVERDASQSAIEKKAREKITQLRKEMKTNPEVKQKLKQVEYAYQVLSDEKARKRYKETKAEPTVLFDELSEDIDYLKISRFSPFSWKELVDKFSKPPLKEKTSLILDVRGNIGGAIDILSYFLGPFIGGGNVGYEFFHQGEYLPVKTKTGWLKGLLPYKRVVVLIDPKIQSTGEVFVAALKKYNVGVVVGETTKGWGTVETNLPLKTKLDDSKSYSLLLVTNLTLRDDNQPIEGKGVDPHIEISNPLWKKELLRYYNSQKLVAKVEKVWREK